MNRSLPTISYLTTMDKYAIMCIFHLVIHCIWHAIIGFLIFRNTSDAVVTSKTGLASLDRRLHKILFRENIGKLSSIDLGYY
ncbi:unnamed protein product [Rotaria sp. Silwood1]|nr:unnamed protein product [Rotaria sp. Silwood1]CAF4992328.1 unnamed protein product [Rotaria sp. Silwood1]